MNQQKESPLIGKNIDNYDFEGTTAPHVWLPISVGV
jgi:hypothetical protein